jgi:hypothetical protein
VKSGMPGSTLPEKSLLFSGGGCSRLDVIGIQEIGLEVIGIDDFRRGNVGVACARVGGGQDVSDLQDGLGVVGGFEFCDGGAAVDGLFEREEPLHD